VSMCVCLYTRACVVVCVLACGGVYARVRACVDVPVCVCVHACIAASSKSAVAHE